MPICQYVCGIVLVKPTCIYRVLFFIGYKVYVDERQDFYLKKTLNSFSILWQSCYPLRDLNLPLTRTDARESSMPQNCEMRSMKKEKSIQEVNKITEM